MIHRNTDLPVKNSSGSVIRSNKHSSPPTGMLYDSGRYVADTDGTASSVSYTKRPLDGGNRAYTDEKCSKRVIAIQTWCIFIVLLVKPLPQPDTLDDINDDLIFNG